MISRGSFLKRKLAGISAFQRSSKYLQSTTGATINIQDDLLKSAKPFHEIPSPPAWPIVGTFWVFLPIVGRYDILRQHVAMREKRKIYGDIWRESIGKQNMVISFRAEDMEIVFKNEGIYPNRGEFTAMKAYRESRKQWYQSTGLLILQGKEWQDLRKKTQKHLMKPKAIEAYTGAMQDVASEFVEKRIQEMRDANQEVPDFLGELYKWSLESVALVGLDTRLGCFQSNLSPDSEGLQLIQTLHIQFELMNKLEGIRLWKYFPTPNWKKFEKASDIFSEISFKYINRACEKLKNIDKNEDKELTLLQALLATEGLELEGALVTVADMIFGGIDTTAHTAGFLLYELAKNQDKQELLYQEISKLFSSSDGKITPAVFSELRYLKVCLKESLRLHPIIPGGGRKLDCDVVISGYKVPAKTDVFVWLQDTCLDERYFKNPTQFLPERWQNRAEKPHPFSYLPFGFGPRSCIGRRLAELEIICLITEVLRRYKVEYHYEDIDILTKFLITPDRPLKLKFIER